jgi:tRNA(adenine34) deaminase
MPGRLTAAQNGSSGFLLNPQGNFRIQFPPPEVRFFGSAANPRASAGFIHYASRVDEDGPIIDLHSDAYFMGQALREARKAYAAGEVPVGAVVVREGRIIARAWNQVETLKDATAHAEMLALTAAQEKLGDWRLEKCTLYVTKEPCPMCAGAIVHCRPERVVFGCPDPKGGAAGGWINLLEANPPLNHRCDVTSGVLGEECLFLLQSFFREARERKKLESGNE